MKKCDCYIEKQVIRSWPISITEPRCNGTREQDICSCDGDRAKCNFYPEIREKAQKNVFIKDAINHFKYGISHDIFKEPVTTYAKLAIEALEKQMKEN